MATFPGTNADLVLTRGRSLPLGVMHDFEGFNFVVMTRHGTRVWLVLMPADANEPSCELELDSEIHRTGNHWHIHVRGLPSSFRYGWRVDGPSGLEHRYDPNIVLIDPAATMIAGAGRWAESNEANVLNSTRRSVFRQGLHYDWQGDHPPLTRAEDSIIYEMHVRSFTCHASSGVQHPGTFAGIIEKIDYLKSLGITAVELLPIHEFDENDCPFVNPVTGKPNRNLWGYNSIAFAAPKASYASSGEKDGQVDEFRDLVRQLHNSNLEIILDVVFNHTAEGGESGRTYSFRGLDNSLYYLLGSDGSYLNFTGCGNTLNCNHPVVRHLVMNCLRYWVSRMHVDGFRFDLASVLGRSRTGKVLVEPPVIESIVEDGVLADTKLIAEPWDAAGVYQVGQFPYGTRWSEWNGKYRDDVRRFWRGDADSVAALATRICGSADLYRESGRKPMHSVNFITCHDGFTLWDLVSYNEKHNRTNGEENRDGSRDNHSCNYGVEGETDDPEINAVRMRQARNLMATLLVSQGVPMILAGDEFLRTQQGNNNAWCQDNEISWVDWEFLHRHAAFHRFVKEMIAFRMRHPALRRRDFFKDPVEKDCNPDISWHGTKLKKPDFSETSHSIALALDGKQTGREPDEDVYIAFNASAKELIFEVPIAPNRGPWRKVVDTFLPSPMDIVEEAHATPVASGKTIKIGARSMVILVAKYKD